MTERGRDHVRRGPADLSIGASALTWDRGGLTVRFDERAVPGRARLAGTVRLAMAPVNRQAWALDTAARHRWRPILPRASVEVSLIAPAGGWRGTGYFDTNVGDEPLEAAFSEWDWSRAHAPGRAIIHYDVVERGAGAASLALRFDDDRAGLLVESPPRLSLPPTGWRLRRRLRSEGPDDVSARRLLEDTPFYARSALRARHDGVWTDVVHESLSLDRLRRPVVRAMLPFRMPRTFW